jgi:hypothetical protein
MHCCQSVEKSGHNNILDELLSLLHIDVPAETSCGMSCSPISVIGGGKGSSWWVFATQFIKRQLKLLSPQRTEICLL